MTEYMTSASTERVVIQYDSNYHTDIPWSAFHYGCPFAMTGVSERWGKPAPQEQDK